MIAALNTKANKARKSIAGNAADARRAHHEAVAVSMGYENVSEAMRTVGRVAFLEVANVDAPSIRDAMKSAPEPTVRWDV